MGRSFERRLASSRSHLWKFFLHSWEESISKEWVFKIPELSVCFLAFFLNFFWEVVHTYFYTLKDSAFDTMLSGWFHCTLGDVMITVGSFWLVSLMSFNRKWFLSLNRVNFIGFIMIGLVYTFFSEWANIQIFKSWSYNESMPIIPWTRVGLTPVLQWIVIPAVVILLMRHYFSLRQDGAKGNGRKGKLNVSDTL